MHYGNTSPIIMNSASTWKQTELLQKMSSIIFLMLKLENSYSKKKWKKYPSWIIWKMGSRAFSRDEDFGDYLDNDGLENIIRDESMQNLNMDD